jgi:16S rRNA (cytidine1402-2'-O)-methyltransferase
LDSLKTYDVPVILFESPHRIKESLNEMVSSFGGDLPIFIGRELTKVNEEIVSLSLREALTWVSSGVYQSRGEFVLILFLPVESDEVEQIPEAEKQLLIDLLQSLPLRQAVDIVTKYTAGSRKKIYQSALDMKNDSNV